MFLKRQPSHRYWSYLTSKDSQEPRFSRISSQKKPIIVFTRFIAIRGPSPSSGFWSSYRQSIKNSWATGWKSCSDARNKQKHYQRASRNHTTIWSRQNDTVEIPLASNLKKSLHQQKKTQNLQPNEALNALKKVCVFRTKCGAHLTLTTARKSDLTCIKYKYGSIAFKPRQSLLAIINTNGNLSWASTPC